MHIAFQMIGGLRRMEKDLLLIRAVLKLQKSFLTYKH